MRYLGPTALAAASLVLLLATDQSLVAASGAAPGAAPGAAVGAASRASRIPAAPVAAVAPARTAVPPRVARTVLPDSRKRRDAIPTRYFSGAAFDACSAPAIDTLQAWHGASPYGAVGIYTSGSQRACDQSRLTPDWVRRVRETGWQLIPTHVGLQAPCSTSSHKPRRIDPAAAVQQGRDEAAEAVRGLRAVGLGKGSPVYLDIESYPTGDATCSKAVVDFTLGWTQALHGAGYHAGFYSSTESGIADLAAAARAGSSPMPDAIWYARWDDRAATDGSGAVDADQWVLRQRIHQHHGNIQETYGGASLTIDRDQVDALVAN